MVVPARDQATLDDEGVLFWIAHCDDHKAEDEHQTIILALVEQQSILLLLMTYDPGGNTLCGFQQQLCVAVWLVVDHDVHAGADTLGTSIV